MSEEARKSPRTLAALLSHLARIGDPTSPHHGLTAGQWTALRYFANANQISRTVSAFAIYSATTRGPASKTVKTLVSAGLLTRNLSDRDGRSRRLDVTSEGYALLEYDPARCLIDAIAELSSDTQHELEHATDRLIATPRLGGRTRFGTCACCAYRSRPADVATRDGTPQCTLYGGLITRRDRDRICVAFVPRTADAGPAPES